MHWFYAPDIQSNFHTLSEAESKHCIRVLRLKIGDILYLTDGKGTLLTSRIVEDNPKKTTVEISEKVENYGKRDFYLHLAVAPTKSNDRYEWFLEKATEIGIDEITPLLCEHSERTRIKPERYNKVIEAAMKQSYKTYHPKLNPLSKFNDFINKSEANQKIIAHCIEGKKEALKNIILPKKNILIMIGPEGGFSPSEIELALAENIEASTLGDTRLRTETAAIVACHSVNFINQK